MIDCSPLSNEEIVKAKQRLKKHQSNRTRWYFSRGTEGRCGYHQRYATTPIQDNMKELGDP